MGDPAHIDNRLDYLYPPFRKLVEATLAQANHEAFDASGQPKFGPAFARYGLFEGYRSQERQRALYAQGRSRPGAIVTNTPVPGFHGYGLAADIVWFDHAGTPHWDGPAEIWQLLGHAARTQGLDWGGEWRFKDEPHVQWYVEGMHETPSDNAKALYEPATQNK